VILWSRQEAAACGGEETRARGLAARGLDLRKPIHALLSECLSGGGSLGRLGRESGARLLDPSLCDPSRTERVEAVLVRREERFAFRNRLVGGVRAARGSVTPARSKSGRSK